jgi:hypothetical protein
MAFFSELIRVAWIFDFPSYRSRTILKGVEKFYGYTEHKMTSRYDVSKQGNEDLIYTVSISNSNEKLDL